MKAKKRKRAVSKGKHVFPLLTDRRWYLWSDLDTIPGHILSQSKPSEDVLRYSIKNDRKKRIKIDFKEIIAVTYKFLLNILKYSFLIKFYFLQQTSTFRAKRFYRLPLY